MPFNPQQFLVTVFQKNKRKLFHQKLTSCEVLADSAAAHPMHRWWPKCPQRLAKFCVGKKVRSRGQNRLQYSMHEAWGWQVIRRELCTTPWVKLVQTSTAPLHPCTLTHSPSHITPHTHSPFTDRTQKDHTQLQNSLVLPIVALLPPSGWLRYEYSMWITKQKFVYYCQK